MMLLYLLITLTVSNIFAATSDATAEIDPITLLLKLLPPHSQQKYTLLLHSDREALTATLDDKAFTFSLTLNKRTLQNDPDLSYLFEHLVTLGRTQSNVACEHIQSALGMYALAYMAKLPRAYLKIHYAYDGNVVSTTQHQRYQDMIEHIKKQLTPHIQNLELMCKDEVRYCKCTNPTKIAGKKQFYKN